MGLVWSLTAISTYDAGINPGGCTRSIYLTNTQPLPNRSINLTKSPLLTDISFSPSATKSYLVTKITLPRRFDRIVDDCWGFDIVKDLIGAENVGEDIIKGLVVIECCLNFDIIGSGKGKGRGGREGGRVVFVKCEQNKYTWKMNKWINEWIYVIFLKTIKKENK